MSPLPLWSWRIWQHRYSPYSACMIRWTTCEYDAHGDDHHSFLHAHIGFLSRFPTDFSFSLAIHTSSASNPLGKGYLLFSCTATRQNKQFQRKFQIIWGYRLRVDFVNLNYIRGNAYDGQKELWKWDLSLCSFLATV